ncbi:MAG: hypothetical protein WB611_31385 [Stellaceae bacterium]
MSKISGVILLCLAALCMAGCTPLGMKPGIERADDLGLQPIDVQ